MRTALITGGAGAVGSATARMLAADGFHIVLADIAIEAATAVCDEIGRDFGVETLALDVDLSDLEAIKPMMATVEARFGRLDCLVNNAGRTGAPTIGDVDLDVWNAIMTINLTAPMLLCQAAAPLMRPAGSGSIVNVASRVYLSGTGIGYTSSKSGLIGLTRALAVQLGKDRIRVNAVAPSFLNSPFNKKLVAANAAMADSFRKLTPLDRLKRLGRLLPTAEDFSPQRGLVQDQEQEAHGQGQRDGVQEERGREIERVAARGQHGAPEGHVHQWPENDAEDDRPGLEAVDLKEIAEDAEGQHPVDVGHAVLDRVGAHHRQKHD